MTGVRIVHRDRHLGDESSTQKVVTIMRVTDDQASALLAQIASEPQVIAQLSATTVALQAIQQAKQDLASLPPEAIRGAFERRHAVLGGEAS